NIPGSTVDTYGWNARWGYYYDSETGLYLCQQRYYDSNQGRWLNRDPIGYAGGVNVYGYCGSGPVGRVDPSGLNWIPPGYVPLDGKLVPLPWHPPSGVQIRWSPLDDCEATMAKLRIVEKMINTHMQWDWNVPAPRGGGRHKGEIAELWKVWGDLQNWASVVCHETPCFTSGNVEPVISSGAGDRSGTAGHGSSDQSNGVPDVDGLPGQIPRAPAPSPSYPTLPMPGRGGAPIYFPMPLPRAA
ncbi:MAG: RHS repeat-associated core domain-containing protein, partial [Chthonomonadaceae bacterium]|nr:RHS repeat-associated core domain-containing protein [Chthonomonadaceae bacterium]